ncbi:hypothetical protein [Paractinoplanes maris]|uniref:hypothetical protein n=1 Tax=Paractinoplanes maris TaxID=1734446 RepID=UPI00202206AC|nr:hypothetical protein [Actinoplanes maris]
MTTSTTPAPITATAVTTFRAAEAERLETAEKAQKAVAGAAATAAVAAATALTAIAAERATLRQEESALRQQLAAARTGPERHVAELALDVNRSKQIHTELRELDAREAKGRADSNATRTASTAERTTGALQVARQSLDAARAEGDADTQRLAQVATFHPQAVALVRDLAGAVTAAGARLGLLLGGEAMLARADAAVQQARRAEQDRAGEATRAHAAVLAAGSEVTRAEDALNRARAAVDDGVNAPARVAAGALVVEATRVAVPSTGQARTDQAAQDVAAGVPGAYEQWLLTLPDGLVDQTVALLDAVAELNRVLEGDHIVLTRALADADARLAAALAAQETQRRAGEALVAAAEAADAAVAVAPAPAELRRAALLRGE